MVQLVMQILDALSSPSLLIAQISLSYLTTVFIAAPLNDGWNSTLQLVCAHTLLPLTAYSFYLAAITSPGYTTEASIAPRLLEAEAVSKETKRTDGAKRFCKKCNQFKPDRAHHCSRCNKCTLKMDHHCRWTANCVGFYNYKYFMLGVSYGTLEMFFFVVLNFFTMWYAQYPEDFSTLLWWIMWIMIGWNAFMGLSVGFLAIFHYGILFRNLTTIEFKEKKRVDWNWVPEFDHGPFYNFVEVFGTNPFLWPLPTRATVPGDGISF